MKKAVILGVAPLLLTACISTYAPQSAQEFRQAGSESKGNYKKESLTVNRSASDIANTLRDRLKPCLNERRVDRTACARVNGVETGCSTTSLNYSATLNTSGKGAEFMVRGAPSGGHMVEITKRPDGGYHLVIADVTPIDKTHSKVDLYYFTRTPTLVADVKGWVTGADLTCQDLSKDY
ncbi:MAG TPA: hypothetical protein VFR06_02510 [Gallionellaceae bacterium]|nr:hypothetical protein [Gallionellaceae bacterium]